MADDRQTASPSLGRKVSDLGPVEVFRRLELTDSQLHRPSKLLLFAADDLAQALGCLERTTSLLRALRTEAARRRPRLGGIGRALGVRRAPHRPSGPGQMILHLERAGATKDPWPSDEMLRSLRGGGAGRAIRALVDFRAPYGITLPDFCRAPAHWHSYHGSAVMRATADAGWHAKQVDLNAAMVSLLPGPASGRS